MIKAGDPGTIPQMSIRSKEIIDNSKFAFNAAFAIAVAYYTFDLLDLSSTDIESIKSAIPYLIPAELIAFYLKKEVVKKIKSAKRKVGRNGEYRRSSRVNERAKKKIISIGIALALIFVVFNTIKEKTGNEVIFSTETISGHFVDSVFNRVQAFEGPELINGNETMSEQQIIDEIHRVFGSQGDNAVRVARCESGLNPAAVGDKSLLVFDPSTGETIGTSIGVFQIRTGGETRYGIFNRARDLGISVEEFIKLLMNPRYNIAYAKNLFDSANGNWSPTWSCATALGIK